MGGEFSSPKVGLKNQQKSKEPAVRIKAQSSKSSNTRSFHSPGHTSNRIEGQLHNNYERKWEEEKEKTATSIVEPTSSFNITRYDNAEHLINRQKPGESVPSQIPIYIDSTKSFTSALPEKNHAETAGAARTGDLSKGKPQQNLLPGHSKQDFPERQHHLINLVQEQNQQVILEEKQQQTFSEEQYRPQKIKRYFPDKLQSGYHPLLESERSQITIVKEENEHHHLQELHDKVKLEEKQQMFSLDRYLQEKCMQQDQQTLKIGRSQKSVLGEEDHNHLMQGQHKEQQVKLEEKQEQMFPLDRYLQDKFMQQEQRPLMSERGQKSVLMKEDNHHLMQEQRKHQQVKLEEKQQQIFSLERYLQDKFMSPQHHRSILNEKSKKILLREENNHNVHQQIILEDDKEEEEEEQMFSLHQNRQQQLKRYCQDKFMDKQHEQVSMNISIPREEKHHFQETRQGELKHEECHLETNCHHQVAEDHTSLRKERSLKKNREKLFREQYQEMLLGQHRENSMDKKINENVPEEYQQEIWNEDYDLRFLEQKHLEFKLVTQEHQKDILEKQKSQKHLKQQKPKHLGEHCQEKDLGRDQLQKHVKKQNQYELHGKKYPERKGHGSSEQLIFISDEREVNLSQKESHETSLNEWRQKKYMKEILKLYNLAEQKAKCLLPVKSRVLSHVVLRNHLATNWNSMPPNKTLMRIRIQEDSDEYRTVENCFRATSRQRLSVISIERVQNQYLLGCYILKKLEMKNMFGAHNVTENISFRGTLLRNVDNICEDNFDWKIFGDDGTNRGICFFPFSYKASRYSDKNTTKRVMFLVRVLVSTIPESNESMKIPPLLGTQNDKNNFGNTFGFDTRRKASDNIIKYSDNEFYPEYVIYYNGET